MILIFIANIFIYFRSNDPICAMGQTTLNDSIYENFGKSSDIKLTNSNKVSGHIFTRICSSDFYSSNQKLGSIKYSVKILGVDKIEVRKLSYEEIGN